MSKVLTYRRRVCHASPIMKRNAPPPRTFVAKIYTGGQSFKIFTVIYHFTPLKEKNTFKLCFAGIVIIQFDEVLAYTLHADQFQVFT